MQEDGSGTARRSEKCVEHEYVFIWETKPTAKERVEQRSRRREEKERVDGRKIRRKRR